jgi:mono/diheme cytochrome c family protein
VRAALIAVALLLLAGCSQRMENQPKEKALAPSALTPSGASARLPVAGTVPADADLAPVPDKNPYPVTMALLERGQQRFNIFCAPCHGRTGDGNGMIPAHGFPHPPDYASAALRAAPERHFYDVITSGYGVMYPYGSRVPPADRWAIAAYIRVLQYARHAKVADLPEPMRQKLEAMP